MSDSKKVKRAKQRTAKQAAMRATKEATTRRNKARKQQKHIKNHPNDLQAIAR